MSELRCSICDTPLTGGLDTYGTATEPLCWEHFMNLVEPGVSVEDELKDCLEKLEDELYDLEDTLSEIDEDVLGEDEAGLLEMNIESQILYKQFEISDVRKQLRILREQKQERPREMLAKWRAAVGEGGAS